MVKQKKRKKDKETTYNSDTNSEYNKRIHKDKEKVVKIEEERIIWNIRKQCISKLKNFQYKSTSLDINM